LLNPNEERFMVSDSLKPTLGPESLMGQRLVKNFTIKIGEQKHAISQYRENESSITVKFTCNQEHLENVLSDEDSAPCRVCSGEKVLRDLIGYHAGYEILNTDVGDFSITMHFQKPRKGVLNG
jgi:hypothetical protein